MLAFWLGKSTEIGALLAVQTKGLVEAILDANFGYARTRCMAGQMEGVAIFYEAKE